MAYEKPADFDQYWQNTLQILEDYPAAPELEPIPIRETDFATLYGVRITSIGPYRLFGYLSIPKGDGPFPAIYYAPKYQSVLEIIPQGTANLQRSKYITFSLASRGQRNSDKPYAAMFPGMLTEGIDNAESYIFRSIVADSVRGLEYLMTRPELDSSRVVSVGNDVALITAALRGGVTQLVCAPGLFYDTAEIAPKTEAYPLEEINDYIRTFPARKDAVHKTLAYLDLRAFAPHVGASTLIMAGPTGSSLDGTSLEPLVKAIQGEVTVYDSQQSSYLDGLYSETWIAEQCGIGDVTEILPAHWR
jgi:cephalosporin-C deacetylase-like acetyl esterase